MRTWKMAGIAVASAGLGLAGAGAVVAATTTGGFDNPSAGDPPKIVKFSVNSTTHDGPGCGLQWSGSGITATVKHGDPGTPAGKGCIAGIKIDRIAAQYPGGRAAWNVWVGEPRTDVAQYGHGPFKGWAVVVGTDADKPADYDFALANTSHDGSTLYLAYTSS